LGRLRVQLHCQVYLLSMRRMAEHAGCRQGMAGLRVHFLRGVAVSLSLRARRVGALLSTLIMMRVQREEVAVRLVWEAVRVWMAVQVQVEMLLDVLIQREA